MLTCIAISARDFAVNILHMIRHMVACAISTAIIRIFLGGLSPVVLTHSLLDNSSYLVTSFAAIDKDVHITKCDSAFEVQPFTRNSSCLILDVPCFTMFHVCLLFLFVWVIYTSFWDCYILM